MGVISEKKSRFNAEYGSQVVSYHESDEINTKNHHLVGVVWPVKGSTGSKYRVRMGDFGFSCDCIAFRKCKHIKYVEKVIVGEEKYVDFTTK